MPYFIESKLITNIIFYNILQKVNKNNLISEQNKELVILNTIQHYSENDIATLYYEWYFDKNLLYQKNKKIILEWSVVSLTNKLKAGYNYCANKVSKTIDTINKYGKKVLKFIDNCKFLIKESIYLVTLDNNPTIQLEEKTIKIQKVLFETLPFLQPICNSYNNAVKNFDLKKYYSNVLNKFSVAMKKENLNNLKQDFIKSITPLGNDVLSFIKQKFTSSEQEIKQTHNALISESIFPQNQYVKQYGLLCFGWTGLAFTIATTILIVSVKAAMTAITQGFGSITFITQPIQMPLRVIISNILSHITIKALIALGILAIDVQTSQQLYQSGINSAKNGISSYQQNAVVLGDMKAVNELANQDENDMSDMPPLEET